MTVTATNSAAAPAPSFQVTVEAVAISFVLRLRTSEDRERDLRPEAQETLFTPVVRFPGLAGDGGRDRVDDGQGPGLETEYEVVTKVGTMLSFSMAILVMSAWREPAGRRQCFQAQRDRPARGAALPLAAHGRSPVGLSRRSGSGGVLGPGAGRALAAAHLYEGAVRAEDPRRRRLPDIPLLGLFACEARPALRHDGHRTAPSRTEDFGNWREPWLSLGLKVGISGQGCAIDSQDGDRILVMYSASRRFPRRLERPGRHLPLKGRWRQLHAGAAT